MRFTGEFNRKGVKGMDAAGIDCQLARIAGCQPAQVHKQRIIDQRIQGAEVNKAGGIPRRSAYNGEMSGSV